jgi:hypothetical protein
MDTQARRLVDLRERRDETELAFESAKKAYLGAEKAFWNDLKDEKGNVKKIELDLGPGYGSIEFTRRETITSRVIDKKAAEAALIEMEQDDATLGETKIVNKAPLNQLVNKLLKAGQPLPDGVDFHARRYIAISRKD